jgi:hypothetical protein
VRDDCDPEIIDYSGIKRVDVYRVPWTAQWRGVNKRGVTLPFIDLCAKIELGCCKAPEEA